MQKRSSKGKGDPHRPYYIVIAVFVITCAVVIIYQFVNPKKSFIDKQVIDHDEFLVHNSQNSHFT